MEGNQDFTFIFITFNNVHCECRLRRSWKVETGNIKRCQDLNDDKPKVLETLFLSAFCGWMSGIGVLSISVIKTLKGDQLKCIMWTPSSPPTHPLGFVFYSCRILHDLKMPRVFSKLNFKLCDIFNYFPLIYLKLHHLSFCESWVCDFEIWEVLLLAFTFISTLFPRYFVLFFLPWLIFYFYLRIVIFKLQYECGFEAISWYCLFVDFLLCVLN